MTTMMITISIKITIINSNILTIMLALIAATCIINNSNNDKSIVVFTGYSL